MAETRLVVEHREQLWSLLVEAAQFEHMIMCQYLYACFSLKTGPDEGLTGEQAGAVARWQEALTGIAIEEMLHLALVMNVMTAIGAAPTLARPNFPRHSEFLPPGVEFALLPFGTDSLTHFLYLERPEDMERVDAAEFVPAAPPPAPVAGAEVMPRVQGFLTAGHLYRGIEQGLNDLAARLGERVLFVGEPRAQATPDRFRWPQLIAVTGLASAHAAIDEIIEQGEGARGDWQSAHYGRFFAIWNEYQKLREQDPSFEPARPVMPAFTQQPYDIDQPQPQPADPLTRRVAELFNLGYEVLLQLLTRFFTHTDETDEQLDALVQAALGLMAGVLKPLGTALTRLPMGPGHPGRTAGAAFQMYYQMGNFVPWREAAWVLLSERAAVLSRQCADCSTQAGVPEAVSSAAGTAARISEQLAGHLPQDLRPAQDKLFTDPAS
jgi:ferritin-like protein